MLINDTQINAELINILTELHTQLHLNNINLLSVIKDTSGEDIMVQCPYHNDGKEKKPSAGIRKSDGMFHCLACNQTHTLPEVISYCFGKDDTLGKFGYKWLVKNFNTYTVETRKDIKLDMSRNQTKKAITYVSEEELDKYRYWHPYWKKRGVHEDVIEMFDLGWDKESDCITMPVRDLSGNTLFVARRSTQYKYFNYPSGVEKPVYGLYELNKYLFSRESNHMYAKLYITESIIDCLLLWQSGRYAVALNGTGTNMQFKQLSKIPLRYFVLATDNDTAGQRGREKIKKSLINKMFSEIHFPSNIKDIGECTEEQINNINQWEVMLER